MPDAYRLSDARLASLDEFGIDAAVLFPNYGLLWEQRLASDREAQRANARAYNRFMAARCQEGSRTASSAWRTCSCTTRPGRSRRSPVCGRQGVRLAMIAPAPVDGKPLAHPDFDPVWAAFSDQGVAPVFHVSEFESPIHPGLASGRAGGRRAALRLDLLVHGAGDRLGQPHPQRGARALPASAHRRRRADRQLGAALPPPHRRRVRLLHPAARRALPQAGRAAVDLLPAPGAGGRAARTRCRTASCRGWATTRS